MKVAIENAFSLLIKISFGHFNFKLDSEVIHLLITEPTSVPILNDVNVMGPKNNIS